MCQPSETLITIVKYIMTVYALVWFAIKASFFHQHLFMMIELTRMLPFDVRNIVYSVHPT